MDGTIVAIATPVGTGAVSLIRLSGPKAQQISLAACGKGSLPDARQVALRKIRDENDLVIDEGVLCFFAGPRSYTGEDVVEFTGHGGVVVTRKVLERFVELGAIPAGPCLLYTSPSPRDLH